ncbi:hypothetical protein [Microbacterium flavum]|uniref:DUF4352 domain-containing protein n=1 Tax=Microbacterium flavum TaxID=415216 RepID=A0ABS5XSQ4_9MICO|nr:hypothetical protein [Microbacterium flavum]MBT8797461.1 hypothetical protein [Microbacterium flavum]
MLVIATASTIGLVWWKRGARRVYVIDHVKLEMHSACVVEDRVVEQVWRVAISITNTSRRPRLLPVLAERATVRADRCVFLANVYLDADVRELNPRAVALAWIEFVLPGGVSPRAIDTDIIVGDQRPRPLRWLARPTGRRAEMVEALRSPLTLLEHR